MRYFSELAYLGTNYHGWQRQPNGISVQETIEDTFLTLLGKEVEVVGCGRTDTGVHASQYFMHFDFEGEFPKNFQDRLNRMLPQDIAIRRIFQVPDTAHARFDAIRRSYEYHIVFEKNPFERQTAWYFPFPMPKALLWRGTPSSWKKFDLEQAKEVASMLHEFEEFAPFCKTHTDARTMKCQIFRSEWALNEQGTGMSYHVSANRFLRGMVRLIVGACINAGLGKISPADVRKALESQSLLQKSWSVPPEGLFLSEVRYGEELRREVCFF